MADGKIISAGSLLVKEALPDSVALGFDSSSLLDKRGVQNLISDLVSQGGDEAHDSLSRLSTLFFDTATKHGYSTPIVDYENTSKERQSLLSEFAMKVNKVNNSDILTSKQKNDRLADLQSTYGAQAQKTNIEHMVGKGSTAGKMALTGARGNPSQLSAATFSPMMATDIHNNPIPVPIRRSFAEGLTSAEHLAMSYEGRANVVKTQTSTSEPGFLFKAISPNLFHEVVTIKDCGTTNGMNYEVVNKKDVMWRVPAGSKEPITPVEYKALQSSGKKTIKLRNTMTCEAPEGVCQLCYGINSSGVLPDLGENVGVVAAQSVSEVLTQAVLATKHKSKVGRSRDPYLDAKNLLEMNKNFSDEATISTLPGKVTKIETTSLGDHNVFVGEKAHYVPVEQDVTVKKGQTVNPGEALSSGTVNPVTLVNLRGLGEGRKHYTKALKEAYNQPDLDSRHFDLLSRNMLKYVRIEDPGETSHLPGDIVDVAKIFPDLRKDAEEVKTKDAVGKKLAIQILELVPGTMLDKNHVDYLLQSGVDSVKISKSGLEVKPIVKGVGFSKAMDPNWISRLSFNRIPEQIVTAASLGQKSEIHGTDPIAAYVMGREFGQGKNGRY